MQWDDVAARIEKRMIEMFWYDCLTEQISQSNEYMDLSIFLPSNIIAFIYETS